MEGIPLTHQQINERFQLFNEKEFWVIDGGTMADAYYQGKRLIALVVMMDLLMIKYFNGDHVSEMGFRFWSSQPVIQVDSRIKFMDQDGSTIMLTITKKG